MLQPFTAIRMPPPSCLLTSSQVHKERMLTHDAGAEVVEEEEEDSAELAPLAFVAQDGLLYANGVQFHIKGVKQQHKYSHRLCDSG